MGDGGEFEGEGELVVGFSEDFGVFWVEFCGVFDPDSGVFDGGGVAGYTY